MNPDVTSRRCRRRGRLPKRLILRRHLPVGICTCRRDRLRLVRLGLGVGHVGVLDRRHPRRDLGKIAAGRRLEVRHARGQRGLADVHLVVERTDRTADRATGVQLRGNLRGRQRCCGGRVHIGARNLIDLGDEPAFRISDCRLQRGNARALCRELPLDVADLCRQRADRRGVGAKPRFHVIDRRHHRIDPLPQCRVRADSGRLLGRDCHQGIGHRTVAHVVPSGAVVQPRTDLRHAIDHLDLEPQVSHLRRCRLLALQEYPVGSGRKYQRLNLIEQRGIAVIAGRDLCPQRSVERRPCVDRLIRAGAEFLVVRLDRPAHGRPYLTHLLIPLLRGDTPLGGITREDVRRQVREARRHPRARPDRLRLLRRLSE